MREAPAKAKRRWLYLPYAAAGVVLLAYYFVWRVGADEMKSAVNDWVLEQRAAGLEVSHGELSAEGFPFFLRVRVETPSVAAPGAWRWRADALYLDALPYDLNKLMFSPEGEQILWAAGYGEWRARASDLRASIARDKKREWKFAMNIEGLEALRADNDARFALTSLIYDLAPDAEDPGTIELSLAADGVSALSDGRNIGPGAIRTVLTLSHADWLAPPDPAGQWRTAGGALTISGLIAEIDGARLSVAGDVNLDRENYPAGRLQAEIANPAGFANLLGQTGALSPQEAEAAAAGLTLMAIAGAGKLNAPIDLRNGEAQIAGVKIADLPKIAGDGD